jgi:hypothetical protein
MVSESWWSSDHKFESYHPHLFDKNQAQDNVGLCKFQVQRAFTWGGVLENNINHILKSYLKV